MPIQNRILVSHESPISILQKSKTYNDFDYALVHLFDTHPTYFQFFKDSLRIYNRQVLLDNSLFELGKAFEASRYMARIEELNPTMALIPDVFEDGPSTIEHYRHFIQQYDKTLRDLGTVKIGAVHGRNWNELLNCYRFMAESADMIAISFDFIFYQMIGEGNSHNERCYTGRQRFIRQLIDRGAWEWNKPHHLLGCSLPQEFGYYRKQGIYNIRSVDTSNPVVHGMCNIRYCDTFGLNQKLTLKLADLISEEVSQDSINDILYNVDCFKRILNGD